MTSGFNPPIRWEELRRRMASDTQTPPQELSEAQRLAQGWRTTPAPREPAPAPRARGGGRAYAELHAHSEFSFLRGASSPEDLVAEAVTRELSGMAIVDRDGLYGAVRFSQAAEEQGLATVYGAALSLPEGSLPVLVDGVAGYRALAQLITDGQLAGSKGRIRLDWEQLVDPGRQHWQVLTGGPEGPLEAHLGDPDGGLGFLRGMRERFGADRVQVELVRHGLPDDDERIRHLAELASRTGLSLLATNAVHYATPSAMPLAQAMAAVRQRSSVAQIAGSLPPAPTAMIRSAGEMTRLFREHPQAVPRAAELADQLAFRLSLAEPRLPDFPVEPGSDHAQRLRELAVRGARRLYGEPESERVPGAWAQVERELAAIERLGFCGYFLIVEDIVRFCREQDIFCQGRGSAANSAVCYVLGITAVDAVSHGLLFERFLAPERDGYPDIDLDIESGRREEAIQYVYRAYGRDRAAQVANVITYRARSAVRDIARALGHDTGQQDAWSKRMERWGSLPAAGSEEAAELGIPEPVMELARELLDKPRHLGIHSGGMVLCDRPVSEVVPIEWAAMEDRSVVQWDKDDCAAMRLVKFDLLGLGMLSALHEMVDLVAEHHGLEVERALLDRGDQAVYRMLCAGDAIGVFQVESRAQLGTLPRLRPETFHELAIQVALIRPGPIQGGSVHPYIRRKQRKEEVRYPHPLVRPALEKTLGVPLFQEQLMQMAMDVAGFNGGDADELRRAMSSKRSMERMARLQDRFLAGTRERGVDDDTAMSIFRKIEAFANYGFPESHAISFAGLVFDSAWFKHYFPAAFCAGLLRSQPMGFYSPQSLISDARRGGTEIRGVDINASGAQAGLEPLEEVLLDRLPTEPLRLDALRLGLDAVRQLGTERAEEIVAEREHGPFTSVADLCQRVELSPGIVEALASAGAFDGLGISRREALWAGGAMAGSGPGTLPGIHPGTEAPALPLPSPIERSLSELWATGVTSEGHPTRHLREQLGQRGIRSIAELAGVSDGERTVVAGLVTHRQRPATATGITFLNLEDEFGMLNVVCSPGLWKRSRGTRRSSALAVHGRLQRADGVISLLAERLVALPTSLHQESRDFR